MSSDFEKRVKELMGAISSEEEQIIKRKEFEQTRLLTKSILKFGLDTGIDLVMASVPLGTPIKVILQKTLELSAAEVERRV